jgi:hypothetical protein
MSDSNVRAAGVLRCTPHATPHILLLTFGLTFVTLFGRVVLFPLNPAL